MRPSRYNRPLALFCFSCLLMIFSEEAWVQKLPPWKFTSVILPWLSRFPGSRLTPSGGKARLPNRQPSQARLACLGTSTSQSPSTSGVWRCTWEPDAWHCVLRTILRNVNFNRQRGNGPERGVTVPKPCPGVEDFGPRFPISLTFEGQCTMVTGARLPGFECWLCSPLARRHQAYYSN